MKREIFLENTIVGRWTVISRVAGSHKTTKWICRCQCGAVKEIACQTLRNGDSQSCGCLRKEVLSRDRQTHGQTQGKKQTGAYKSWASMVARIENPSNIGYSLYGGRGITIDLQLRTFEGFYSHLGERPEGMTLDRINCDGNYEIGNVRWATHKAQQRNKRNNRLITFQGRTQPLNAWVEELGIPRTRIWKRLHMGWSIEKAFHQ